MSKLKWVESVDGYSEEEKGAILEKGKKLGADFVGEGHNVNLLENSPRDLVNKLVPVIGYFKKDEAGAYVRLDDWRSFNAERCIAVRYKKEVLNDKS